MNLQSHLAQAFLPVLLLTPVSLAEAQARRAARKPPPKVTQTPPTQPGQFPLETIKVTGNHNYLPDQIIAVSGLKLGKPATNPDFEAARDRLVASGAFHTVSCSFEPAKDGKGYDSKIEVTE